MLDDGYAIGMKLGARLDGKVNLIGIDFPRSRLQTVRDERRKKESHDSIDRQGQQKRTDKGS